MPAPKPVHRCQGCGRTLGHDEDCTTYRDWGKEPDPAPIDPACGLPDGTRQWVSRIHTSEEMRAASAFMTHGLRPEEVEAWPIGLAECVYEIKLIIDDLDKAGLRIHAGGGTEAQDHVRTLLVMRDRMAKIARMHHKGVDEQGGTWGDCTECGHHWPCPTYDWARETSDRNPAFDAWDRNDDND